MQDDQLDLSPKQRKERFSRQFKKAIFFMVCKQLPEDVREKIEKIKAEEAYYEDVRDLDDWKKESMEKFFFVLSDEAARIRFKLASLKGEKIGIEQKVKINKIV